MKGPQEILATLGDLGRKSGKDSKKLDNMMDDLRRREMNLEQREKESRDMNEQRERVSREMIEKREREFHDRLAMEKKEFLERLDREKEEFKQEKAELKQELAELKKTLAQRTCDIEQILRDHAVYANKKE